jgi:hypothetical protein
MIALLGIVYVSLPYNIAQPISWWYVGQRMPSLMAPLILLLPAASIAGRRRLLFAPLIVAAIVLPLKLASLYRDFSRRNAAFMELMNQLPRGSTTLVVVRGMWRGPGSEEKSGDPATSAPVYWHFASWPMALKGGYSAYVFDQGIPIRPKVRLKSPHFAADTFDFREAPQYEYYLIRYPLPRMERDPAVKVVDRIGDWALYHRLFDLTDEP